MHGQALEMLRGYVLHTGRLEPGAGTLFQCKFGMVPGRIVWSGAGHSAFQGSLAMRTWPRGASRPCATARVPESASRPMRGGAKAPLRRRNTARSFNNNRGPRGPGPTRPAGPPSGGPAKGAGRRGGGPGPAGAATPTILGPSVRSPTPRSGVRGRDHSRGRGESRSGGGTVLRLPRDPG